ncbi:hypothetical protein KAFR_0A00540 [Kazachstania africana CBS 2517]|uniref:Mediator of RNA polymerase II transcription subunit 11 n=1 Tax=Kazachstania africana (strain ATCC 22294 / BCRC 22015 / CBS 2517 / CECT 1963 / NBRC 1671 / NRRL Y-8276) TaxID=1071382 RepID=H2AM92_KAZAF|nr:hypothetical protein KAFR_0A00540 [Kazachstania africana CBS 2517]CCF55492.1 hypothetical protein KAFR_0A00540 [Kazachstania africana CBS 2517]
MQPQYVRERLDSLECIDLKLCTMLKEASQVVFTFSEIKKGNVDLKRQFENHVKGFYNNLEEATIRLRNEIKLLDENTGTRLLPISVNKKNLGQDEEKLAEQVTLLANVLQDVKNEASTEPLMKDEDEDVLMDG